jgi:hypothetical protein
MFADDMKMRVTQEPGGTVRMVETDVPPDLLEVKISHIAFRDAEGHGANSALTLIMSAPEEKTYMTAHDIGPLYDTLPVPGNSGRGRRDCFTGVGPRASDLSRNLDLPELSE